MSSVTVGMQTHYSWSRWKFSASSRGVRHFDVTFEVEGLVFPPTSVDR